MKETEYLQQRMDINFSISTFEAEYSNIIPDKPNEI
jgi:hypothetical protein